MKISTDSGSFKSKVKIKNAKGPPDDEDPNHFGSIFEFLLLNLPKGLCLEDQYHFSTWLPGS